MPIPLLKRATSPTTPRRRSYRSLPSSHCQPAHLSPADNCLPRTVLDRQGCGNGVPPESPAPKPSAPSPRPRRTPEHPLTPPPCRDAPPHATVPAWQSYASTATGTPPILHADGVDNLIVGRTLRIDGQTRLGKQRGGLASPRHKIKNIGFVAAMRHTSYKYECHLGLHSATTARATHISRPRPNPQRSRPQTLFSPAPPQRLFSARRLWSGKPRTHRHSASPLP